MFTKAFAAGLCLVACQALKVTQENTDTITDMDEIGFFKDSNTVYNQQTASEKKANLWTKMTEDTEMLDYYWADWTTQFTGTDNGSFCQDSDEMKRRRLKITHTQGLVGQINWVSEPGHSYTGFYAEGFTNGYVRFSQTLPLTDLSTGLLPSVAIKALRDNAKSQNIFGMPSFHETTSWSFFGGDMFNRVEPFAEADENGNNDQDLLDTIITRLAEGDSFPFSTAIGNFAEHTESTDLVEDDVVAPYELTFVSPFKDIYATDTDVAWYDQLSALGTAGTNILDVWAKEHFDSENVKIASIYLDTDLTTSKFGDERFHFQHQRTHLDFKYLDRADKQYLKSVHVRMQVESHEWDVSAWPSEDEEAARNMYLDQIENSGCPFAWLLWDTNATTPTL